MISTVSVFEDVDRLYAGRVLCLLSHMQPDTLCSGCVYEIRSPSPSMANMAGCLSAVCLLLAHRRVSMRHLTFHSLGNNVPLGKNQLRRANTISNEERVWWQSHVETGADSKVPLSVSLNLY